MLSQRCAPPPVTTGIHFMALHDRPYSRGAGGSDFGDGFGGGGGALRSIAGFFNWSFPVGAYFGIRVRVHILFLLLVLFRAWPDATLTRLGVGAGEQILQNLRWIGLLFGSVLLHEFGHCFGCRAVGGRADDILMWPLGGLAFCEPPRRPWPEFVTVICGPLVNVVLAGASYLILLAWLGDASMPVSLNPFEPWTSAYWFAANTITSKFLADLFVVNYALMLFNVLLIFYPFDGGRLVQIALWVWLGYQRSMMIATTLGMVGAAGVAVFGVLNSSFLLVLIAIMGFMTCLQQRQQLKHMVEAEPEFDPRFAAAYETQQGRRGAFFGAGGASGGRERGPSRLERWREARRAREEAAARKQAEADETEMNRILDKVRDSGLQGLTKRERDTLQRATDRKRRAQ